VPAGPAPVRPAAPPRAAFFRGAAVLARTTSDVVSSTRLLEVSVPFGHGLAYTTFCWEDIRCAEAQMPTYGAVSVSLTVRNTGERSGTEVVQVYLHDPVAQVTRPVVLLIGYARVQLEPGQSRRVEFTIHADLTSFIGRAGRRVVEPGRIELRLGPSSAAAVATVPVDLTGPQRVIEGARQMSAQVRISEIAS